MIEELGPRIAEWEQLLEDHRQSRNEPLLDTVASGFDELCDFYLQTSPEQREAVRQALDGKRHLLNALLGHIYRAAGRIESVEDTKWLRIGLAAASIEDRRTDFRDLYVALGALCLAAARAGIDPWPHFRAVVRMSSREARDDRGRRAFIGGFRRSAYFRQSVAPRLEFIAAPEHSFLSGLSVITTSNACQVTQLTGLSDWGGGLQVRDVAWSSDGRMLGVAVANAIRLYSIDDLQAPLRVLRLEAMMATGLAFSPDDKLVAAAAGTVSFDDEEGTVHLWEVTTGAERAVLQGHSGAVRAVAFSPHGVLLASGSVDRTVRLWDVETSQQSAVLEGHRMPAGCVAFSPDGTLLASMDAELLVLLWDVEQRTRLVALESHAGSRRAIAFSPVVAFDPDGIVLASAGRGNTVRLWNVTTGELIDQIVDSHTRDVHSVSFSPDGCVIASGGRDRAVKLWDLETRELLTVLEGHKGWVERVAFSPDGTMLASCSSIDGTVRLWGVGDDRASGGG
jgi:sugar lactone lactonase YvrE